MAFQARHRGLQAGVNRRAVLAHLGAAGAAVSVAGPLAAQSPTGPSSAAAPGTPGAGIAPRRVTRLPRPIPFGCAVNPGYFATDGAYVDAILRLADFVVPEWGMKWADLRPSRGAFTFTISDQTAQFAQTHGLPLRGHTLVWNEVTPPWLDGVATAHEAEREMIRHIEQVMLHYRGQISSWDVVNEPIADKPGRGENLRGGVWTRWLGPDYIELALKTARRVDPRARLIVNEYGIEHRDPQSLAKRGHFRALIGRLLDRGMPLDGVGLQAHLTGGRAIDHDGVAQFVRDMRAFGLDVLVTELDVNDKDLPADVAARDAAVADTARAFLGAVFAGGRPQSIATWGISDRYTWLPKWHARRDGLTNRPLPLDHHMQSKPLMAVVEDFCRRPG